MIDYLIRKWEKEKGNIKSYYQDVVTSGKFCEELYGYNKIMKVICDRLLELNYK